MLSTDEDIFYATLKTLKIFEKSDRSRNKKNTSPTENRFFVSDSIQIVVSGPNESLKDVFTDTQHVSSDVILHDSSDAEFQKTIEANETIMEMYKYYLEKLVNVQDKEEEPSFEQYFADIMCPLNINITVAKMKAVLSHINTISEERAKLKQVLRSNVVHEVWKINKDYHKAVINFFNLASEIVKDIDELVVSLESIKGFQPDGLNILQERELKVFAVLQEFMDNLNDFRIYVKQQSKPVKCQE